MNREFHSYSVDILLSACQAKMLYTNSRDERQSKIVTSCNSGWTDARVQEDKCHENVVHVTFVTGEKDEGDTALQQGGGRRGMGR